MIYKVVVYVGDFTSHDRRVVYTTSKESDAKKYLFDYMKDNPDISKAYIECDYNRRLNRNRVELEED